MPKKDKYTDYPSEPPAAPYLLGAGDQPIQGPEDDAPAFSPSQVQPQPRAGGGHGLITSHLGGHPVLLQILQQLGMSLGQAMSQTHRYPAIYPLCLVDLQGNLSPGLAFCP